MHTARPRTPRYPFLAAVKLTDLRSETQLLAETADLSLTGCYVETMTPFPVGTEVSAKLTHAKSIVLALGTVIHSQPEEGMGIAFTVIEPSYQAVLEGWLSELGGV